MRKHRGIKTTTDKLTSFALPSVQQVVDGGSESFGLFLAGKVQTNLTVLNRRKKMSQMTSLVTVSPLN